MNTTSWTKNVALGLLLGLAGTGLTPQDAAAAEEPAQVAEVAQVNINTANAETIAQTLKGIGLRRAEAIVAYRESHGPFQSVDELSNVKGVGSKILEANRSRVSL